jgi:type II secretory pathway component PulF
MLIILFLFTAGLLKFVIPQFKAILEEMNEGKLPVATRMLIRIVEPMMSGDGLILLFCLVAMGASCLWIYGAWRRRRPEKPYLLSRFGDSIKWHLPILHWFERNRAMIQVVEVLRMSLDAGCPVNEAIRSTLRLDVNLSFRTRLAGWLRLVERGAAIGDLPRRCGWSHALAWAFDGGAQTGNTPAVLEMLGAHYQSNHSYRVNLARFILAGRNHMLAAVGFVVFAVFRPSLATLSQNIANVYP